LTYASSNTDNFCYRHPDRQSFVLCQRCGRTICAECQTQAPVGVHCPECVREARGNMPRVRPQVVTRMNSLASSGGPLVTWVLMALSGLGFLVTLVPSVQQALLFYGAGAASDPWRIVTGIFAYGGFQSIIQLAFNIYMLWAFGTMIERQLGRVRYAALYLLGALGAEVAASLFIPQYEVLITSAAMFGLFGAFYVILRSQGQRATQILVLIALNIVIGIFFGTPWQNYIGAAVVGGLTAFIFMRTQNRNQLNQQRILTVGLAVVLLGALLFRSASLLGFV
jgi:membrane associated rhomboid family serine protease